MRSQSNSVQLRSLPEPVCHIGSMQEDKQVRNHSRDKEELQKLGCKAQCWRNVGPLLETLPRKDEVIIKHLIESCNIKNYQQPCLDHWQLNHSHYETFKSPDTKVTQQNPPQVVVTETTECPPRLFQLGYTKYLVAYCAHKVLHTLMTMTCLRA